MYEKYSSPQKQKISISRRFPRNTQSCTGKLGKGGTKKKKRHLYPLELLEVLPEEADGIVRAADAELHQAVAQHLLNVVVVHVLLALAQALLLLEVRRHYAHRPDRVSAQQFPRNRCSRKVHGSPEIAPRESQLAPAGITPLPSAALERHQWAPTWPRHSREPPRLIIRQYNLQARLAIMSYPLLFSHFQGCSMLDVVFTQRITSVAEIWAIRGWEFGEKYGASHTQKRESARRHLQFANGGNSKCGWAMSIFLYRYFGFAICTE